MTPPSRIVICGAGAIGASVAYFLARRGARPFVVDRAGPGAAASGRAAGFLAADWNAGTPLDALMRASFALHREIAEELGAERLGYRPMDALMTAAADEGTSSATAGCPTRSGSTATSSLTRSSADPTTTAQVNPLQFTRALDRGRGGAGSDAGHRGRRRDGVAGPVGAVTGVSIDGESHPADVVVLALGPWTSRRSGGWRCPRCSAPRREHRARRRGAGPGGLQRVPHPRGAAQHPRDLPTPRRSRLRQRLLRARRPARRPGRDRAERSRPARSSTAGPACTPARSATPRW